MLSQLPKKLLDRYREALRLKHYSSRTEKTYVLWVREYILYNYKRHPAQMSVPEINQFLAYLATKKEVSASTQNQALSAILFLYRHVLHVELDETSLAELRPRRSKTVPTVLSKDEARRVIDRLTGVHKLIAQIMYGGGLHVMETMRLRVKDIDFDNQQIIVRDGKGENDRLTILPDSMVRPLQLHLIKNGYGSTFSRPLTFPKTNVQALLVVIICTKRWFKKPSGKPPAAQK
jgi:site-specific recombinase XerD